MNAQTDTRHQGSEPSIAATGGTTGILTRRAALGRLAGAGLAAAVLTTVGSTTARTQATPTPEVPPGYEPNGFSLEGPGMRIGYGTTSIDGRPTFTYRGHYPDGDYRGDDIRVEGSTALGRMVSVRLVPPPNVRAAWLTVLLPGFSPVQLGDPPIPFATVAIITTHLLPSDGPGQTYEVVPLEGTAGFAVS